MHINKFVRGEGKFVPTPYVPTEEKSNRKFPLLLTTGRVLSQYNVGAQTRRTANNVWHHEDTLDIHEADAEMRGIKDGSWVKLSSRVGETIMRARITDEVAAGVVYTTFHFPESGANVITTEFSDWATNCPEYKVTAVQVEPSEHMAKIVHHGETGDAQLQSIIRMANQIASNIPALSAPEIEVAHHLTQFWTPVMRQRLQDDVDPAQLSDVVKKALELVKQA